MPATSLAQLLTPPTVASIYAKAIGNLQAAGFPTTDWADGGPEKAMVMTFAQMVVDETGGVAPAIARGSLVKLAPGAWLDLRADDSYNLERNPALSTIGTEALFCAPGAGPHTITAGQLWFLAASGLRYNNTSGGQLKPPGFSGVTHGGSGAGVVTVPSNGTNTDGVAVAITITGSGAPGTGTFSYTTTGGFSATSTPKGLGYPTQQVASQTIPTSSGATFTDPLTGIKFTFTGTFTAGDTYSFQSFGALGVTVQSESPNNSTAGLNYIDGNGTVTQLSTPLPGVTCINSGFLFGTPVATGGGAGGSVAPTEAVAGTPPAAATIGIVIQGTGTAATAPWTWSLNGGAPTPVTAGQAFPYALGSTGIAISLLDNGDSPSFTRNDAFAFSTPGTWISQQGTDAESDAALAQRCSGRWPLLSNIGVTIDGYVALARMSTPQVVLPLVVTDGTINAQVNIFIAGQGGPLPSSVCNLVQAFLEDSVPETDKPVVVSVVGDALTLAGSIQLAASAVQATVQAAVQVAIQNYLASVGAGGSPIPGGVVRVAALIDAIMNVPGVIDAKITSISGTQGTVTGGAKYVLGLPGTGNTPSGPGWATIGPTVGMFTWQLGNL